MTTSAPAVLGTAAFSLDALDAAGSVIDTYLEADGRLLDTARVYGPSEDVLGGWLRAHGDVPGLRILTKGGHPDPADWLPRLDRAAVQSDARTSVARLGRPADLYLLHRDDTARAVEDIADTLVALIDEGLAREVGVSNWSAARTAALDAALADRGRRVAAISDYLGLAVASAPPDWPLARSLRADSLSWAEGRGVPVLAWSSQSSGYFAGRRASGQFAGAENERRRRILDRVAERAGTRPEAVLARWSATISPTVVPVVASRSPERLARLLADLADTALDPAVAALCAELDPDGSRGRALFPHDPVW